MFTSYRVIELVRRAISSEHVKASDTDVAKAMGISRAAVSAYKSGRDVMTHETLARANALMKLPDVDVANIGFDLLLEQARTDNERAIYKSMREMAQHARSWAKKHTAIILLAALGLWTAPRGAAATELGVGLTQELSNQQLMHYAQLRTRRRRRLAKLRGCLKSRLPAPLLPAWARIRSMALTPSGSPHSLAYT